MQSILELFQTVTRSKRKARKTLKETRYTIWLLGGILTLSALLILAASYYLSVDILTQSGGGLVSTILLNVGILTQLALRPMLYSMVTRKESAITSSPLLVGDIKAKLKLALYTLLSLLPELFVLVIGIFLDNDLIITLGLATSFLNLIYQNIKFGLLSAYMALHPEREMEVLEDLEKLDLKDHLGFIFLSLSFIFWDLASIFTLGLLHTYITPYKAASKVAYLSQIERRKEAK